MSVSVSMKRVFITGISGFLGACVARFFLENAWHVFGACRSHVFERLPQVSYFSGDPSLSFFRGVLDSVQPEVIIHCAGSASVPGSMRNPLKDFVGGPLLTSQLLEATRMNCSSARFIFLSSAAVYGNPQLLPVEETTLTSPLSPYGFHKLQSEILCEEYSSVFGVDIVIARIFSAYGLGLQRQVVWDICRAVAHNLPLRFQGTGTESRDFIHGKDVAAALFQMATVRSLPFRTFNIATGRETTIRKIAEMALAAFASHRTVEFDGIVPVGTPCRWRADMSRLKSLGFQHATSLEEGLGEIVQHLRQA